MADAFLFDVFFSYSSSDRARVTEIASRLKDEGVNVWLDVLMLEPGHLTPLEIDRAIERSRLFVLCLSPAAVTSDWVDLERSAAIFGNPGNSDRRFIPLLLKDCTIPATVRPFQLIDFSTDAEAGFAKLLQTCREAKTRLPSAGDGGRRPVPVVAARHSDFGPFEYSGRIKNFVAEYLGTADEPVPFGGRDQEMAQLTAWVDDATEPPYLLLTAPAGRGKSALLVRWRTLLQQRGHIAIVFFPVSVRFETNLARVVFSSLSAVLAHLHGEPVTVKDADVLRGIVLEYLQRPLPDGRRLVVIIDGIDEAADWQIGADLFPTAPPAGLRVLVSARVGGGARATEDWLHRLGWSNARRARTMSLTRLALEAVPKVLIHMGCPLDQLASRDEVVRQLYELSEGDPLVLRLYVEELWGKRDAITRLRVEDLAAMKPGLTGYMARWWADQQKLWKSAAFELATATRDVLDLLAAAFAPLKKWELREILARRQWAIARGVPPSTHDVSGWLQPLHRFLIGDGVADGYTFSHPRLAQYFWDQLGADEQRHWDRTFLAWADHWRATRRSRPDAVSAYPIQYYAAHLTRSGAAAEDWTAVLRDDYGEAWETIDTSAAGWLEDVRKADKAFAEAETQAEPPARSFLGQRLHAALIQATGTSVARASLPPLMLAAVDRGLWTLSHAVSMAKLETDPGQRARLLLDLSARAEPQLRPDLLRDAFVEAQQVADARVRGELLIDLVDMMPSLSGTVLSQIPGTHSAWLRSELLVAIVPHLPANDLPTSIQFARSLPARPARNAALEAIASLDSAGYAWEKALELTRDIDDDDRAAAIIAALTPQLPLEAFPAALDRALAIETPESRFRALMALARQPSGEQLPLLPRQLRYAARNIVDGAARAEALWQLPTFFDANAAPSLWSDVIAAANDVPNPWQRSLLFVAILERIPDEYRAVAYTHALASAESVPDTTELVDVFTALAPHMPPGCSRLRLQKRALHAAVWTHDTPSRCDLLSRIAPALEERNREAVWQALLQTPLRRLSLEDFWRVLLMLARRAPAELRLTFLEQLLDVQEQLAAIPGVARLE